MSGSNYWDNIGEKSPIGSTDEYFKKTYGASDTAAAEARAASERMRQQQQSTQQK